MSVSILSIFLWYTANVASLRIAQGLEIFHVITKKSITTSHVYMIYKVNSCLARYSPGTTTTKQLTNRAPNEPAMPICAQECTYLGAKKLPTMTRDLVPAGITEKRPKSVFINKKNTQNPLTD